MEKTKLDDLLMREMYNAIRSAEIKNIKTQKKDDKQMVAAITKYILDKVKKEAKDYED